MIDNVRPNRSQKQARSKTERFELDLVRILQRHWLLIGCCISMSCLLAGVYATITKPIYESKASIMLIPKDSTLATKGLEGARETGVINEDILATHVMLVQSPKLISSTLSQVRTVQIVNGKVVFHDPTKEMLEQSPNSADGTLNLQSGEVATEQVTDFSGNMGNGETAPIPTIQVADPATANDGSVAQDIVIIDPQSQINQGNVASSSLNSSAIPIDDSVKTLKLEDLPSLREAMSPNDKSVAAYVSKNLTVTRGGEGQSRDAQVLTIAFRHTNKEDAQIVVAAIIESFQKFLDDNFADKNNQAAKLITAASEQLSNDLDDAQKKYADFRQNAPMLWSNEQSTNVFKLKYEQIQAELTALQLKKTELTSRLDLVQKALVEIESHEGTDLERMALIDPTSATRVGIFLDIFFNEGQTAGFMADQPTRLALAQAETSNLLKLKAEYRAAVQELGELNPKVLSMRESIAEIESYLKEQGVNVAFDPEKSLIDPKKLVDAYVRLLRNDLQELDISETSLLTASEIAETEAKKLISYELEGEALRLKLDQQQDLFKETVDNLRHINMTKDYAGFVNEILEEADIGEEVWPSIPICLLLGTLGGVVTAASGILLLELKNRSLRSSHDIETLTGVPILSYVPRMQKHEDKKLLVEIMKRGSQINPIVYTVHTPQSQESEIFRGMRTSLFFKSAEIKGKVFAVTSSNSGDGKSTITANLICCMAQAGRKVLLVECDLRRPAVATLLGCGDKEGLSDVLNGHVTIDGAIRKSEMNNLSVLSAGTIPENPAELLGSNEFKDLIDKLEQEYDFVILDCPPVLAVSDPCIVSDVADGVVIIVRVNPKSRVELQRTVSMLRDVQATIVGTIVNASHLEDEGSVGRDGYYVGYGYGTYGQRANGYYTQRVAPSGAKKRKTPS